MFITLSPILMPPSYLFSCNIFVIITDPKPFFGMGIRSMSSWIWIYNIPVIILYPFANLLIDIDISNQEISHWSRIKPEILTNHSPHNKQDNHLLWFLDLSFQDRQLDFRFHVHQGLLADKNDRRLEFQEQAYHDLHLVWCRIWRWYPEEILNTIK